MLSRVKCITDLFKINHKKKKRIGNKLNLQENVNVNENVNKLYCRAKM